MSLFVSLASLAQKPLALAKLVYVKYAKYCQYRKFLDELSQMSDRELSDLGLDLKSPSQIAYAAVYGNGQFA